MISAMFCDRNYHHTTLGKCTQVVNDDNQKTYQIKNRIIKRMNIRVQSIAPTMTCKVGKEFQ